MSKSLAMFSVHSDPLASIGSHESGGQNIYVYNLAINLDKLGWNIDIFTRLDDIRKKRVVRIGKHSRVIRLEGGSPTYMQKGRLHSFFPEIYNNFLQFINFKNPYDIFHGHHYDGGWMALQAQKQFQKPFIVNFHSLGQVRSDIQKMYSSAKNGEEISVQRFEMEKKIIEAASFIISLSETEKRDLSLLYGATLDKIGVIPGGVNIKQFALTNKDEARKALRLPEDAFILLFVGRLEWRKGIGTLISAAKLLKNTISKVNVLIVGGKIFGLNRNKDDWNEYQRLLEKARYEGVEEITRFIGRVDHNRLPLYYSAADILVIPSYYESFGLVALEGIASQIPVVASRKGGLRITIKDGKNGLLFEPRNPLDLKEKILKIYESHELAARLTKNGYEDVLENYSWKDIAGRIENLYNRFIGLNSFVQ